MSLNCVLSYENEFLKSNLVLMDKSSCLPAEILQPNPGSDVLDVCAAPGNKTFHLASLYSQAIQIYSIDRSKTRCKLMIKLLTSRNVSPKCVKVYKLNWLKCDQSVLDTELTDFPNGFGYALVDPSCTGSGMLHSRFNTDNTDHDEDRLDMLSSIQFDMIRNCIELYGRSLKRLVYSTCSIHQEENELVVEKVLDSYKAFIELENIMEDTWKYRGLTNRTRGCIRADPKSTRSNGFFVASFRFLR
ncbi:hypothetical protein GJ496_005796 [Pomphorhynchus laevis]|nr:hypothetical protein GJ496_005796 [Pomphorhynchus laevis]